MPKGPFLSTGRTPKQERWLQKFVENGGNGVQAAEEVYDCSTKQTAYAIASENLHHHRIRPDIEKAFVQEGITVGTLANRIKDGLNAHKDDKEDHSVRLRAVGQAARMLGVHAPTMSVRVSIGAKLTGEDPAVLDWILEHGRQPSTKERQAICSGRQEPQEKREDQIELVDESGKPGSA